MQRKGNTNSNSIQYNTKQRKPKWEKHMDHRETSIKIKIKSRLTEIAKTDR